ncbi:MAG: hypothetical protein M3N53_14855 [Actinomycetota bacterium]|nr:hypothetical protein [Actinomycetota bacterium]
MRRSIALVVIAVVGLLALSACEQTGEAVDEVADDVSQPEQFETAEDLVEALNEGGVECRGLEVAPVPGAERGVCRIDREPVSVGIYDDNDAMQQDLEARRDENESFVVGGNWILIARSPETADAAREAIGGKLDG